MGEMNKEEFRKKVKEESEREWIREAIRARKFSEKETLEQGLKLIKFALEFKEAAKDAGHG